MIRTAKAEDAAQIIELQKRVLEEDDFLVTTLEEFQISVEDEKKWIAARLENERETFFVAEVDGELVGMLVFQSPTRIRLSHTGTFGMMVDKRLRGKGIGKALISELLAWAKQNPYIEKVSLGVFSTNEPAIELYKKMGFIEEGRKVKEFKVKDSYVDDILMYQFV